MNTFWVTFYSYKGGVGRSMALANTAALLAKAGRRVLMIDFDLEAPGLDSFADLSPIRGQQGVVEYVSEYLTTKRAPKIAPFIQVCRPSAPMRGKLWLMPSGSKTAGYNAKRMGIRWADLYEKYDGEKFIENWKADVTETLSPDYVFIDSRTGLTDIGGVCTLHFPDLVVLLFSLNDQNINGIAEVATVLKESGKPPLVLPVATPVPNLPRDNERVAERFKRAEEALGVSIETTIRYNPIVALQEAIYAWSPAKLPISEDYNQLKTRIEDLDRAGLDSLLKLSANACEQGDFERAKELAEALRLEYSNRADALYQVAETFRLLADFEEHQVYLKKAVELEPAFEPAYRRLAAYYRARRQVAEHVELIEQIVARKEDLPLDYASRLYWELATLRMHLSQPREADAALDAHEHSLPYGPRSGVDALALAFNRAEARRRAGETVSDEAWRHIIELFERGPALGGAGTIDERMNRVEAMHIPYAMVGDKVQALRLLKEVADFAAQASPRERIFSVAVYEHLPLTDFTAFNQRMIDSISTRNELWDGMKLPPETEKRPLHESNPRPKERKPTTRS